MAGVDGISATFRHRLFVQLEAAAWQGRGLSPLNRVVVVAIVLSVTLAVLETEITLRENYHGAFSFLDYLFGVLFLIEYLLRLCVAG